MWVSYQAVNWRLLTYPAESPTSAPCTPMEILCALRTGSTATRDHADRVGLACKHQKSSRARDCPASWARRSPVRRRVRTGGPVDSDLHAMPSETTAIEAWALTDADCH
jgi:hypothetical protein